MTLASVSGSETSPVVGAPSGPPKAASCPPHDLRREARTPDDYGTFPDDLDSSQEFAKYTCTRCGYSECRQECR
jgi:hypothetical protein